MEVHEQPAVVKAGARGLKIAEIVGRIGAYVDKLVDLVVNGDGFFAASEHIRIAVFVKRGAGYPRSDKKCIVEQIGVAYFVLRVADAV